MRFQAGFLHDLIAELAYNMLAHITRTRHNSSTVVVKAIVSARHAYENIYIEKLI